MIGGADALGKWPLMTLVDDGDLPFLGTFVEASMKAYLIFEFGFEIEDSVLLNPSRPKSDRSQIRFSLLGFIVPIYSPFLTHPSNPRTLFVKPRNVDASTYFFTRVNETIQLFYSVYHYIPLQFNGSLSACEYKR